MLCCKRLDRTRESSRKNNGQAYKIFIAINYQRIGTTHPTNVMSTFSKPIDFTSP